jgi:hypothetical protein
LRIQLHDGAEFLRIQLHDGAEFLRIQLREGLNSCQSSYKAAPACRVCFGVTAVDLCNTRPERAGRTACGRPRIIGKNHTLR